MYACGWGGCAGLFVSFPWTWCSGYRIMTTLPSRSGEETVACQLFIFTWVKHGSAQITSACAYTSYDIHSNIFKVPFGSVTLPEQTMNFDFSSGFWENFKWIIVGTGLVFTIKRNTCKGFSRGLWRKETPLNKRQKIKQCKVNLICVIVVVRQNCFTIALNFEM